MGLLRSFGQFWYDFIVGDDWKIAAATVLALAVLCTLMLTTSLGDLALSTIGGALLIAAFSISLILDVRSAGRSQRQVATRTARRTGGLLTGRPVTTVSGTRTKASLTPGTQAVIAAASRSTSVGSVSSRDTAVTTTLQPSFR